MNPPPLLIVGTGASHRKELMNCISRHSDFDLIVASDRKIQDVNHFIELEESGYASKIEAIMKCCVEKFVYIDTDVTVYSMNELEFFLNRYALSVSYEPLGHTVLGANAISNKTSNAPYEYQTGVIAVNRSINDLGTLELWWRIQKSMAENADIFPDQVSFKEAVCLSGLAIGVLPQNLNYRAMYHQLVSGKINIVHSRNPPSYTISDKNRQIDDPRYILTRRCHLKFYSPIFKLLRSVLRS